MGGVPPSCPFWEPFPDPPLEAVFGPPLAHLKRHFDLLGSIFRPPAPPMRPKCDLFLFLGPPLGHSKRHFDRAPRSINPHVACWPTSVFDLVKENCS